MSRAYWSEEGDKSSFLVDEGFSIWDSLVGYSRIEIA